jgi:hypothetical protein
MCLWLSVHFNLQPFMTHMLWQSVFEYHSVLWENFHFLSQHLKWDAIYPKSHSSHTWKVSLVRKYPMGSNQGITFSLASEQTPNLVMCQWQMSPYLCYRPDHIYPAWFLSSSAVSKTVVFVWDVGYQSHPKTTFVWDDLLYMASFWVVVQFWLSLQWDRCYYIQNHQTHQCMMTWSGKF